MSSVVSQGPARGAGSPAAASRKALALADRLEQGAKALAAFAAAMSDAEWQSQMPKDGRRLGTIVHHVASVYPIEVELAATVAGGQAVTGVTWDTIHQMNGAHAAEHPSPAKAATIDLLRRNSAEAADAIRALTDEQLDRAMPVSIYGDAPLTSQFVLEDHAVRHAYHHLSKLRALLAR